MGMQTMISVSLALIGFAVSWSVWVSVSIFKHAQEIALLKQEIQILIEVKEVLEEIKFQLKHRESQYG